MPDLRFIPKSEFDRVAGVLEDAAQRVGVLADMCRLNTLVEVKRAGSGHLGSSFSAMDVVAWLYFEMMKVSPAVLADDNRDIFFSSKGHDVPGLYAILHALGVLDDDRLFRLRRLGGLDGHPDISVPGCETNTGSLGMGVSKARGMWFGKGLRGVGGRVYVMLGDGELQEGQIWESVQTAAHHGARVTAIVDHNKIQTDMPVEEIIGLGELAGKFRAFGWAVERCDGHDLTAIDACLARLAEADGPGVLIADTIKGRGVTFMEEISEQPSATGKYRWHSGAPDDASFSSAFEELHTRLDARLEALGQGPLSLLDVPSEPRRASSVTKDYVAEGFGRALVRLGHDHPELVVLDGDLSADCRVRYFEETFPDRFIENGIAEQDMVSVAGGLALQGTIPVCNSFATFLCARANEQIYNNACEGRKIIYAAHFAGMIPAGPGKSHQSVRDISLMASVPTMVVVQPSTPGEADLMTEWAVTQATGSVCLRINIGPSPRSFPPRPEGPLEEGRGWWVREGTDGVLITYGPVMLHEALLAAELAETGGLSLAVVNHPWANRFQRGWVEEILSDHQHVFTLDDHLLVGGMGERFAAFVAHEGLQGGRNIVPFGLEELPECGTPWEVLRHHRLDGYSLACRIFAAVGRDPSDVPSEGDVYDTLDAAQ